MKKWLFTVIAVTLCLGLRAQTTNIVRAEYFIDTDPGFGNGTSTGTVSPANDVTQTFTIPSNKLSTPGFHRIYVRAKDNLGAWSATNSLPVFVIDTSTAQLPNVTYAEYFIDKDPGQGNGHSAGSFSAANSIISSFVIPADSLSKAGFHRIYVRAKDSKGKWSITNSLPVFVIDTSVAKLPNLTKAEYFIDTDPGIGMATALALPSQSDITQNTVISLSGLPTGFHRAYIRCKDSKGNWSITYSQPFMILEPSLTDKRNIEYLEYYINTDPGQGNGVSVPIVADSSITTNITVPLDTFKVDSTYQICFRARDDRKKWSTEVCKSFVATQASQPDNFTLVPTASLCQGQKNVAFSMPPIQNATYKWSWVSNTNTNNDVTINESGMSATIDVADNAQNGTLKVVADSGNGRLSASRDYPINFKPKLTKPALVGTPSTTAQIFNGILTIPQLSFTAFTNSTDTSVSYNWLYNNPSVSTDGSKKSVSVLNFNTSSQSGTLKISATNKCSVSDTNFVPINVTRSSLTGTIQGSSVVNYGENNQFTAQISDTTGKTTYEWIFPKGQIIAAGLSDTTKTLSATFLKNSPDTVIWCVIKKNSIAVDTIPFKVKVNKTSTDTTGTVTPIVCEPQTVCDTFFIDSFSMTGGATEILNNASGCSGTGAYSLIGDNSALPVFYLGENYNVIAKSGNDKEQFFGIWFDYNGNNDFNDPGEFIGRNISPQTEFQLLNQQIKNNSDYVGNKTLRIRCRNNKAFESDEACNNSYQGETEDYILTLKAIGSLSATNVITPNGDGKNDFFIVSGINPLESNQLVILDRFGNQLFQTSNYQNDWQGQGLDNGTYYFSFLNGKASVTGYLVILK